MSPLLAKQIRFARAVPRLLDYAFEQGFMVTLGETYRTPVQAEINALGAGRSHVASLVEHAFPLLAKALRVPAGNGIRTSLHVSRLAIDLQLFDDKGVWLQHAEPYERLGDYWESLGSDHRWGGRFGDTPHYSIEHEGRK